MANVKANEAGSLDKGRGTKDTYTHEKPERKESVKCEHTRTLPHWHTRTLTDAERKPEMNHFIRVGNAYDMRHKSISRPWGKVGV